MVRTNLQGCEHGLTLRWLEAEMTLEVAHGPNLAHVRRFPRSLLFDAQAAAIQRWLAELHEAERHKALG